MTRRYAELMDDTEAERLQEAAADVAYLTGQGESPTEAIAKVASAARFSAPQTNLLTYAYSNGIAAEKRGSAGGPMQRLAEFDLPDPKEIHRLVYGKLAASPQLPSASDGPPPVGRLLGTEDKTASVSARFLPRGMATFETDPTGLDHDSQRALFGLGTKTAGEDETDEAGKPVGRGLSISHTCISIGLGAHDRDGDGEADADPPQSLRDHLRRKIGTLSPALSGELEAALLKMLGIKEAAMTAANAEADDAFAAVQDSLDRFGARLGHRHLAPHFKRAGLLSVNAYCPEIAAMIGPYLGEVDGCLVKESSHDSLDVTANHPWVAEAAALHGDLETVADLTVLANRKSAEYDAVCTLYRNRDRIRKSADWSSFLAGSLMPGIGSTAKDLIAGRDQSKEKHSIRRELLDDLDDRLHDLSMQEIGTQSMLNEFNTSDEILNAYGMKRLLPAYNDLLRTAPGTMRNRALARAMLQQHMTQGRMAPTEFMPALQMNKLDPRKDTIVKEKKKEEKENIHA